MARENHDVPRNSNGRVLRKTPFRKYLKTTDELKRAMFLLRYGSLERPGPPQRSLSSIARIVRVHVTTINRILKKMMNNGGVIVDKRK